MRCDGECISGHGFHHCSIWAEGRKHQLKINCFSPAKTAVALLCSIVLLFTPHRQLLLHEWKEEPDALCHLNDTTVFLPNISSNMLF